MVRVLKFTEHTPTSEKWGLSRSCCAWCVCDMNPRRVVYSLKCSFEFFNMCKFVRTRWVGNNFALVSWLVQLTQMFLVIFLDLFLKWLSPQGHVIVFKWREKYIRWHKTIRIFTPGPTRGFLGNKRFSSSGQFVLQ